MLAHVLLTLALVAVALLFGASAYESVVMAPNYGRDPPASVEAARRFLVARTPAQFFRPLSPIAQVLVLAGTVAGWRNFDVRWHGLMALGVLVLLDVITFSYHYPRLAILFREPLTDDAERLRRAAREWASGNHVRTALLFLALLLVLFTQLHRGTLPAA
jgi:hypothetical protein